MPNRPQSANRLTERIHAAVRAAIGADAGRNLLVACSGGADSTCLAHAVAAVARREGWTISLGHVRHGVRPEDAADREAVRVLGARLGVPFAHEALAADGTATPGQASEQTLRAGRYRALARMARAVSARAILTGHTMDDQAETVLLHLIRGAGLDGLAGMQSCSPLPIPEQRNDAEWGSPDGMRLIRPLLGIRRDETAAYCAAHALPVRHDATNDDQTWRRNWLRHTVLPELRSRNPDVAATLARAAALLAEDAHFLREETDRARARCGERDAAGATVIDRRAFADEPRALRMRIVRRLIERHGGGMARADLVSQAEHALSTTRSSRIAEFGRVACAIVGGAIIFGSPASVHAWIVRDAAARFPLFRGSRAVEGDAPIPLGGLPDTGAGYVAIVQSVRADLQDAPPRGLQAQYLALPTDARLSVRNRLPGDRFHPLGGDHSVLLREYLSARDIPAPVRDWLPLLVVNDTIAWVIGHAFGAAFVAPHARATHIALLQRVVA